MKGRVICPYCNKRTKLVSGAEMYPNKPQLKSKQFYLCRACDAYVGCHNDSSAPLGTPANRELRVLRMRAHRALDAYWRDGRNAASRRAARASCYTWLARALNLDVKQCHIGMFDADTCLKVIELCRGQVKAMQQYKEYRHDRSNK